MSLEANKAIARAYLAATDRGDRAAMLERVTDDLVWIVPDSAPPPYAGRHEGGAHIVDMMLGAVAASFEAGTQHTEVRLMIGEGDVVVAETRMRARTPAGETYDNRYVFVYELREGRIREIREHVDTRYAASFFEGAGSS